ncbi:hypothetical protein B0H19DRAFT_1008972 [Mycena capillaripes]|nr:hypothetical protein B0H19DRAFT_1008972 [Mycena capillaripes]
MPPKNSPKSAPRSYLTETPYKDYLHTNFVPSEDECYRILDVVASLEEERKEISAEISQLKDALDTVVRRLQDSLDEMGAKRDSVQNCIVSHLALVSGARRLPHDILGEIFMACLPQIAYSSMSSAEPPQLLSHICSEWRRLAISMPRLWTSLHIEDRSRRIIAPNEKVTEWLTRSRSLPLSISIYSVASSNSVLQPLIECSHRWEHIRFDIPSAHIAQLEQLSPDDVPLLTTAVIREIPDNSNSLPFICAPSIQAFSLRSIPSELQALGWLGAFSRLSLGDISLAQALAALGQCPNLENCTLKLLDREGVSATSNPIHLRRLERLCVVDGNLNQTTHLFHHIVLPNLRTLEYSRDTNAPLDTLLAPFRTSDKLIELNLSTPLSTDALTVLLRHFSMLQSLLLHRTISSFKEGITTCKLFALLTPRPNSKALCPHLESICCLGLGVGTDKELLTLIDARRTKDGIHPLSNVHIAFPRDRKTNIIPEISAACVTVDLHYPSYEQSRFIKWATGQNKTRVPAPNSLKLETRRQDPDIDWAAVSGEWLAEYDEWGRRALAPLQRSRLLAQSLRA